MARKAPQIDVRGVDRRAGSAGGWWEALALGAGLPFVVAVVLYRLKVPLGKPKPPMSVVHQGMPLKPMLSPARTCSWSPSKVEGTSPDQMAAA